MKATLKCVTDDIDEISDNNYFDIKSILFQITNAVKWSFWSLNIFLHIGSKKGENSIVIIMFGEVYNINEKNES